MYRPLMEGKVTMTELKTTVTFQDLREINALLDMEHDMRVQQQERQEQEARRSRGR